ncbi:class I SAM-dependent methyltransferase [Bradyrhizobium sp.]|jgi:Methyltransferase domain|uniref:class I SAM-dependent methyltransferase n=1 Tax=Bradyrhizobium sp. TaxID=376 RepID=UPI003C77F0ED
MSGYVGAQHEFHDANFVRGWANRFVPTRDRLKLFDMISEQISQPSLPNAHVVELGIGPGYMARHLLERNPVISYEGLDFSEVFFEIAKETIGDLMHRVTLTKADLMNQAWPKKLSKTPGAIISTWALHDLGSQQAVADVYVRCYETLPKGGVLANGDFIKPEGTTWQYEPGRFEIGLHFELLRNAGFSHPISLAHLEPNIEDPKASENYACIFAVR